MRIVSQRRAVLVDQLDREPALLDPQPDPVGAVMAGDVEAVPLEQVENGDSPLLLDIGVAAQDRPLVEDDVDDPGVGHGRLLAGAASARQRNPQPHSRHSRVRGNDGMERQGRDLLIHISYTGLLA